MAKNVNAPLLQVPITSDGHKRNQGCRNWCCWRTSKRACTSCCLVFSIFVVVISIQSYMNDFGLKAPEVSLQSIQAVSWDVGLTPPRLAMLLNLTLSLRNPNAIGLTANWVKASVWKDDTDHGGSYHLADGQSIGAVSIQANGDNPIPIQARVDYQDPKTLNSVVQAFVDDCGTDPLNLKNTTLRIILWGEVHIVINIEVPQISIMVTLPCKAT